MKIKIRINEDFYSQYISCLIDREEEEEKKKKRIIQANVLNKKSDE
jgi:hypothetical protein